jgi:signal transduction histidine kinase
LHLQNNTSVPFNGAIKLQHSRVLLVDDDPINLIVVSGLLTPEGYTLSEASSGEEALSVCETFKPDLVVMDVRLPGIDGFDTCRELIRRYGSEAPPVIFVTARNTDDDVIAGFQAGGVDYLTKPVSEREAIARIRTHLANRHLVRQLAQALSHKNRLLGIAAHDLRNPLASIRGLAQHLNEGALGQLTPEQQEVIAMFHDASNTMLTLVNELLDVSVIEAGQLKLRIAPTNLTELVTKSVHLNSVNAASKNTTITFVPGHSEVQANLDAAKIRQVVDNLLSNAVKYSPLGSAVSISVSKQDNAIVIAVRDQGPGIPEQERSQLFKEFGTLSVQSTGGEKSTGLGLAICRRIVEAHNGSITALNLPERGCEFSVRLPCS